MGEFRHAHGAGGVAQDCFEDEVAVLDGDGVGAGSIGPEALNGATGVEWWGDCGDGEGLIGGGRGGVGGILKLE